MILAVLLYLVPFPSTQAQTVPTGCVTIQNRFVFGYLAKGLEDENHNVAFSATPEQWFIREGLGVFRITHVDTKEELFESESELSFASGRPVFLRQREVGMGDSLWEIEPGSNADYFVIRNIDRQDCLGLTFFGQFNFNVLSVNPECSGKEYEWQLNKVPCKIENFDEYDES